MLVAIIIFIFVVFFILNKHEKSHQMIHIGIVQQNGCKDGNKNTGKKNELISLLNNISSADKVILSNIKERWIMTKDIINQGIKDEILTIIRKVLSSISIISNKHFFVNTIENMYVMKDEHGNYRSILNCFIYDIKNHYTIKLSMDIVSYEGEIYFNFIDIDESSINNILNNYDVKWDAMGILSNYDMFDENIQQILDNYYTQKYDIIFINQNENIDKTSTFTLNQLVNLYMPLNIPVDKSSPHFCQKNINSWDSKGIKRKGDFDCIVNNIAYQDFPNIPSNFPGAITSNPDKNKYSWLFEGFKNKYS